MSTKEEAWDAIIDERWPGQSRPMMPAWFSTGFDAGVASVAPRVVTTVAELDALPAGSVVRDAGAAVFERAGWARRYPWRTPNSTKDFATESLALPATVLWFGGTE